MGRILFPIEELLFLGIPVKALSLALSVKCCKMYMGVPQGQFFSLLECEISLLKNIISLCM